MVYCDEFEPQKIELYRDVCHRFARAIDCYSVTWRKKLKIHLILHLPDMQHVEVWACIFIQHRKVSSTMCMRTTYCMEDIVFQV